MRRLNIQHFKCFVATMLYALFLVFCTSCQDDSLFDEDGKPVEGLPATVTLKFDLTDMPQITRAIVDDARSNYCDNVWVGIYLVDSKERVYSNVFVDEPAKNSEVVDEKYILGEVNIKTTSGRAYIVAVANVDVVDALPNANSPESEAKTLREVLEDADTWDKFRAICAKRSEVADISQLEYSMPMSGYYSENDDDYKNVADATIPTVDIVKGENNLPGSIKLRRLISYNAFYITAGENINLEMESWQVCNNPYLCYVLENENEDDKKNAGDVTYVTNASGAVSPYNAAVTQTKFTEITGHPTKKDTETYQSFEFYQYENKHTACTYVPGDGNDWVGIRDNSANPYDEREREYKNTYSNSERTQEDADGEYHSNTGVYKSLVEDPNDLSSMVDNNASYVVLKASLSYYYDPEAEEGNDPSEYKPVSPDKQGAKMRTAKVQYVIHLGYCEGESSLEKARDFNCRRNSKYVYTVHINGVKNIVVEAEKESDDPQSGAEGQVYDTDAETWELDSHYNVFNIKLTNKERSSLGYRIEAPYDNTTYILDSSSDSKEWENSSNSKYPFYSWIRFKPTSSENVLAVYKENVNDNGQWTLAELRDVANHPGNNDSTNPDEDITVQWYTVFVDEYVYHIGETLDENGGYDETTWKKYTNKGNRTIGLYTTEHISKDGESEYIKGKYGVSQRAIQTYYRLEDDVESAMGVEHFNESYGLNFRWDNTNVYAKPSWSEENGRYNLQKACKDDASLNWSEVVSEKEPEYIAGDYNDSYNRKLIIARASAGYPVTKLYNIKTKANPASWKIDPSPNETSRYYYINTACMNRNRDLNGNGKIDDNELRWFLPTYNQYAQMFIGQDGLVDPIFEWTDYSQERFTDNMFNWNGYTQGRMDMHYATSDGYYLFAEEGYSRGTSVYGKDDWGNEAYQMRCVRYLGDNLADEPNSEKCGVEHAFSISKGDDDRIFITASHYTDICMRSYVSTFLPPHLVNSEYNKPYRKMEVSKTFATSIRSTNTEITINSTSGQLGSNSSYYPENINYLYRACLSNDLCSEYTQEAGEKDKGTWRLPNIKEIAMIWTSINSGKIDNIFDNEYEIDRHQPSCTHEYFINFPENTGANQCQFCFFGRKAKEGIARSLMSTKKLLNYFTVRCVRDVKQ